MAIDTRLTDLANSLLVQIALGLVLEGISVPNRQYIHSGDIAHDLVDEECAEALVVTFQGIIQGLGETTGGFLPGTPVKCAVPLVTQYDVALLRCVPSIDNNGTPPTQAALQASGEELLNDAMTLTRVVIDKELAGTLREGKCTLVGLGAVVPVGPSGGVGGTTLSLFVELA